MLLKYVHAYLLSSISLDCIHLATAVGLVRDEQVFQISVMFLETWRYNLLLLVLAEAAEILLDAPPSSVPCLCVFICTFA